MYSATEDITNGNPQFRWLYDHLVRKTAGTRMPDRHDIDPSELKDLLTAINLIDLVPDGDDFRLKYRLVGSLQSYFFAGDRNVTGQFLDAFWGTDPTVAATIKSEYRSAIERRGPVAGAFRHSTGRHAFMRYQRAIFPLTDGGNAVAAFICLHVYETGDQTRGQEALRRNPVKRA